nr:MAG TPA: Restriction endonuclease [Caudoviricetes sp.]
MLNYQSARWKKKRAHILKRDGYLCQYAKRYGRHVEATRVHHIYPSRDYPEYAWQDWNLISLSASAHELMHDRETGELSELGEKLKNKTIPPSQS